MMATILTILGSFTIPKEEYEEEGGGGGRKKKRRIFEGIAKLISDFNFNYYLS